MMRRTKLIPLMVALVFATSSSTVPRFVGISEAVTRADISVLGKDRPIVEQSYPPIIATPPRQGTANVNPQLCKRDDYYFCDIIKLTTDPQGQYEVYSVKVSLSWPTPHRAAVNARVDNIDGNDLTIGVWEPDPTETDPSYDGKTRGAWTGGNKYIHPEVVFVGTDNPDPAVFYLIINNSSSQGAAAINKGYTLRVEFVEADLGGFSGPKKKGGGFSYTPPVAKATPKPPPSEPGAPQPKETISVKVPGPDGELTEIDVPVFFQSANAKAPDKGTSPLIPILAVVGLGLGGAFLYFFVWRRRRAA
ncbi:MAG: hypothetical protein ABIS18_11575 [Actinomycetota bacterium]